MLNRCTSAIMVLGLLGLTHASAQNKSNAPSGDFFTGVALKPVIQGGDGEVKQPEKVKKEEGILKAATAQDAVNAAAEEHQKKASGKKETTLGLSTVVAFQGGVGFVASGVSSYQVFENNTATRASLRSGYVRAYTQAKVELYKMLNGLDSKATTLLEETIKSDVDAKENKSEFKSSLSEEIEQRVEGMMGGYLTWEVLNDEANKVVTVTLVSMPKDAKINRITSNIVEAGTMAEGIDQIINEVSKALVPPVGGRIITVKKTGEKAFVGFGSAVFVDSKIPQVRTKLLINAQRIAQQRADDSIGGILKADMISWVSRVKESSNESMKDYGDAEKADPAPTKAQAKKVEKLLGEFKLSVETSDSYKSVRENRLPPGLMHKAWISDTDDGFALAISVWIPSVSKLAGETGAARAKPLLEDDNSPDGSKPGDAVRKPGEKVKPLPSGRVDND